VKLGRFDVPDDWPVKGEAGRTFNEKLNNGFFARYMAGDVTIDVGYHGGHADAVPIFPHAIGVDLNYPEYDGTRLPFSDESVDTVYSSHMLEHVVDYRATIRDWYRVLKSGGFIVCVVPHQFLYEKKAALPSVWNADHKRFYTPASLLREFEQALEPNTYRIRHLCDQDDGYTYDIGPDVHAGGGYEIELVVQKIKRPAWNLAGHLERMPEVGCDALSRLVEERDRFARESARWFDAAVLAPAEEIFRSLSPRRNGGLHWLKYLFSRQPQAALSEARRAEALGQWERATRFYVDALRSDPGAPKIWQHLGDCLKATGKNLEAEFAYRQSEHRPLSNHQDL
jgi:SAM-dependent methyltransferase